MKLDLRSDFFQTIRLIDVFLLAPVMVRAGIKSKNLSEFEKNFLVVSGIATAVFNGYNFIKINQEKK